MTNFLFEVVKTAVLSSLRDLDTILYRQDILKDCLKHFAVVRDMYDIAVESINRQKKDYWWWGVGSRLPGGVLHGSIDVMQMFVGMLRKLRNIACEHADQFASEGFKRFFAMLKEELSEDYLATVGEHLTELKFRHGIFLSAELGNGNASANH